MVDFTTPNLCGASPEFNKLSSQFSGIKNSLQGQLEGEIDALKSELTASLAVLEADIKGLIPELPAIPDVSFISEIQNLAALPAGSFAGLSALANIQSKFGSALSGAGFSLDSLVGDATAAFSGGIDLCGGGLPNFVIGPNGLPALKPDDVGMPSTDPKRLDEDDDIEGEAASSLLTPSAEIASVNASKILGAGTAVEKSKESRENLQVTISSESGQLSTSVINKFDEADVISEASAMKAGVAPTPAVEKVRTAVATNKTLPAKVPAITLTGDAAVEVESLKVLQDEVAEFENELQGAYEKISHLLLKYQQKSPFNRISDGKRKIVLDRKTKLAIPLLTGFRERNVKNFLIFYRGACRRRQNELQEINFTIGENIKKIAVGNDLEFFRRTSRGGFIEVLTGGAEKLETKLEFVKSGKITYNPSADGGGGDELIESMEIAYEQAEETFSVPA